MNGLGFDLLYLNRVFESSRRFKGTSRGQLIFGDALFGLSRESVKKLSVDKKIKYCSLLINYGHCDFAYDLYIDNYDIQDKAPKLKALMESQTIEKIFHFARFDIAALSSNLNIKVTKIFCTKVASRLARTYSPRHGLKEVISELVGIELDKQSQSSDWGKVDELSESQLIYAANDTRYLIEARTKLEAMLRREGRWSIAERCFNCLPVIAELDTLRFSQIFEH